MGGESVAFSQTEIGKEAVEGRFKTAGSSAQQFLAGDIAVCQCIHPAPVKLVMRAQMLVHANQVLVSLVGLDLRRAREAVVGVYVHDTGGAGKILVEHRRHAVRAAGNDGLTERGRFGEEGRRLAGLETRSFVIHKEECLVLYDRATERPAELILVERCLLCLVKVVARIQRRISSGVEQRAVETVAAGLGGDIDDRTVVAAVLGGEIQGLNL